MEAAGLREAYESAAYRLDGMTYEQFKQAAAGFEVHPVRACGRVAGAVLVKGSEIHACVLPWARGKWFGRREIRLLNGVIERYGCATTSATTEQGKRFVQALGFTEDGSIFKRSHTWVLKRP